MEAKTTRGTCPCCFRKHAVRRGTMTTHGYRAPGRGTGYAPHVGQCGASGRFAELEVSPEGTLYVIGKAIARINENQVRLERLNRNEPGIRLMISCWPTDEERAERRRSGRMGTAGVDRLVSEADVVEGRVNAYSGIARWPAMVASAVAAVEAESESARWFIALATEELHRHHPGHAVPAVP